MTKNDPRESIPPAIAEAAEAHGWRIEWDDREGTVLRRGTRDYLRLAVRYEFRDSGPTPWIGRPRLVSAHAPRSTFWTAAKAVEYLSRPTRAKKG